MIPNVPFETDHIIAQKHQGPTELDNLAFACFLCNSAKGPNLSGIDPTTKRIVRLFHPRRDAWNQHFKWKGPILTGRTSIGRATIVVLEINTPQQVLLRRLLLAEGWRLT